MIGILFFLWCFSFGDGHAGSLGYQDPLTLARITIESGMRNARLEEQVNAENLTNIDASASTPEGTPYQGKIVLVRPKRDPHTGALVADTKIISDMQTPFREEYMPGHPAADPKTGVVKKPNVHLPVVIANANESALQARAHVELYNTIKGMQNDTIKLMGGR